MHGADAYKHTRKLDGTTSSFVSVLPPHVLILTSFVLVCLSADWAGALVLNLFSFFEFRLVSCLTIDLLASCFLGSPCCFLWVMCWGLQCSACSLRPALVVLLWPASCGPLFCCLVFVCVVAGSFGRVFVVCCCFPLVALSCFVFWCSGLVPRGLLSPCPATGEDPRKS